MDVKRVVIVAEGSFGIMEPKDYDIWTQTMVRLIGALRRTDRDTRQEVPAATVEVVPSLDVLREKLCEFPQPSVVIFRTRDMIAEARRIKREFRDVRVIVFTGLIPDDEIVIVSKTWALSGDALKAVICE